MTEIRAPAERPVPPQQKEDPPRRIGVQQPTQETDRPVGGNRWLPIDSAPKDGSRMIISDGDVPAVGLWQQSSQRWVVDWDHEPFERPEPSIWCPLPNANIVPSALASTGEQPDCGTALQQLVDAAQNLIVSRNGVFSLRASNDEIRSFMWALTRAELLLAVVTPTDAGGLSSTGTEEER